MKAVFVAVLWGVSLICAYHLGRTVSDRLDYSVPASVKGVIGTWSGAYVTTNDWLRHPRFRQFGRFVLFRPADRREAGLYIGAISQPPTPVILIEGSTNSGRPTHFSFYDAAGNMIMGLDRDSDGVFDRIGLATTNGIYQDEGLTGTWHFKRTGTQ